MQDQVTGSIGIQIPALAVYIVKVMADVKDLDVLILPELDILSD